MGKGEMTKEKENRGICFILFFFISPDCLVFQGLAHSFFFSLFSVSRGDIGKALIKVGAPTLRKIRLRYKSFFLFFFCFSQIEPWDYFPH